MKEDAAISVAFTLEAKGKLEVFVALLGLEIAVFFRHGDSVDDAVLHIPALLANLRPAGEVFAIEQGNPVVCRFLAWRLGE